MAQHILASLNTLLPVEQAWRLQVLQQWNTIIGNLSSKVKLHRIDETSVVLSVTHPSLAQELLMLSDIIRDKINAVIGHSQIKAIHFRTINGMRKGAIETKVNQPQAAQLPQSLNEHEEKILDTIVNNELRNALSQFYKKCKQRTLEGRRT